MTTTASPRAKLEALAGSWIGEEEVSSSAPFGEPGTQGTSHVDARMDLDGAFLITDYAVMREGREAFRGHGVHGWDAESERFTLYWFDALAPGLVTPALGKWEDNVLIFERTSKHAGRERWTYTFEGSNKYHFCMEHSRDGVAWSTTMDGVYTRREGKAAK
jgi:hypothetical protein